jgi:(1->4)-alpha-D-glucan 1-alpha-D-glucosylmutase
VDYVHRHELLQTLITDMDEAQDLPQRAQALLESLEDGRAKLYVTWKCLSQRRRDAIHFQQGDYLPLVVRGAKQDCLCAHAWRHDDELIIAAAPRWFMSLMIESGTPPLDERVWQDTLIELPPDTPSAAYMNIFTGEHLESTSFEDEDGQGLALRAAQVFAHFPVALLRQELVKVEQRPL